MSDKNHLNSKSRPWYQEPWPWILISGPLIVVIASIVTAIIAVKTNDGLVTDDYYRKGLAVNQTIARNKTAELLGLTASVRLVAGHLEVRLAAKNPQFSIPTSIKVTISHPTRAGLDQTRQINFDREKFSTQFQLPASGHWLILIEDIAEEWRLLGNIVLPSEGETIIGGSTPADIRNQ